MAQSMTRHLTVFFPQYEGDRFSIHVTRDNNEETWTREIPIYEYSDIEAVSRYVRAAVLKALSDNRQIWTCS